MPPRPLRTPQTPPRDPPPEPCRTHPDEHRVLALELGDEPVAPQHLGFVEGPKAAHHLDAALRRVRHGGAAPRRAGAAAAASPLPTASKGP